MNQIEPVLSSQTVTRGYHGSMKERQLGGPNLQSHNIAQRSSRGARSEYAANADAVWWFPVVTIRCQEQHPHLKKTGWWPFPIQSLVEQSYYQQCQPLYGWESGIHIRLRPNLPSGLLVGFQRKLKGRFCMEEFCHW